MTRKHRTAIVTLAFALLLLSGCAPQAATPAAQPTEPKADAQVWRITVHECQLTDTMTSSKALVEYDGQQNQVSYSDAPPDGFHYLLLLLDIDKTQPGKEKFKWSDLRVMDAAGTAYPRHENDTFLELHGLARIKATDLSIGSNHGYVCYLIPTTVDAALLTLVYTAQEGQQRIALHPSAAQ